MKKNKTLLYLTILCLLPTVIGLIIYNRLPSELPIHFDINGVADNYASKDITIFGLPLFFIFINFIIYFAIKYDPKNKYQNNFMMKFPLYFVVILENIIIPFVYMIGLGYEIDISNIVMIPIIILFIIIGNFLPKCKQNYTIGIKLPWTLNDERNWHKTHRLAGFIWVGLGILSLIFFFILPREIFTIIFIIFTIIMVVVPIIYSFILYHKTI